MLIGDDVTEITSVSQQQAQAASQTIRVSVKQLEQISDLFSTLTIERNGLNQQLTNVRQLVSILQDKVQQLEASNLKLRSAYDDSSSAHSQSLTLVGAGVADVLNIIPQAPHSGGVNYGEFDALEFDRYGELHLLSQEVMDTIVQVEELTSDIDLQLNDTERTNRDLNRTAKEIQSGLTAVRMRPVNDLLDRFPRALKNLAIEHGKPIEVKIRGGSTLIERSILENLNDPLMHLIRNAFDHGIEPTAVRLAAGKKAAGTIELSAGYRGNQTVITIKDDGGGIDLDKIRAKVRKMGIDEKEIASFTDNELLHLIFEPGFSTAEKVTDLSGRGVGMDVVRTNIRELRGDIQVDTKLGTGTTFTITVPLTLSVVRVLLVDAGGTWMAIPSNMVDEIILLEPDAILETGGQHLLKWEDLTLRLIDPSAHFYHSGTAIAAPTGIPQIDRPLVLTIDRGTDTIALKVDRFWGEQEVAIRQPEGKIQLPPGFTGFTILGDGRIVPLVDAIELIRSIDRETALTKRNPALSTLSFDTQEGDGDRSGSLIPINPAPVRQRPTIMIVDDSINVRRFLALTLEKAGYQVEQAKDGQDAVDKLQGGLKPKAVICDIEMPRMDGYGFLSNIKGQAKYKDLPILMLTSRSGEKHRKIAMNLGATGYFSKPFKEADLLSTLDGLVKK
jgi:two-component system, chemotaxis family, sensor histidine kinase and response regulator PixL